MPLPLALLPVPRQRYFQITAEGLVPLAGGTLEFYIAGTDTPQEVYADWEQNTSLGTSVALDADGYAPAIFILPIGYKVRLLDAENVQVFEQDGVEDVGQAFLANQGKVMTEGTKDVPAGYQIESSDNLVTVNEPVTNPAPILLQDAATRGLPVIIKNLGPTPVDITPISPQTIEGNLTVFRLPAAVTPTFPTVELISDGVTNWWIRSSHGLA